MMLNKTKKTHTMKTSKIYLFKVSSQFSSREINARSKKEAIAIFLQQVPSAKGEKLTVI